MQICRPFITLRNGQKLFAHQVGKKAFCWDVSEEKHQQYLNKQKNKAQTETDESDKE